jgi:hypothetical protein
MKVKGVALGPGVSRNGRKYTVQNIGAAVARAQERIASGRPLIMRSHHAADDDSTRIAGKITRVEQDEQGRMVYEGELSDNLTGRDIGILVRGGALSGVSISGQWASPVRREQSPDGLVETADDLEVEALDFTARPGVAAASVQVAESVPLPAGAIRETVPAFEALDTDPYEEVRRLSRLTSEEFALVRNAHAASVFEEADARRPRSPWARAAGL